MDESPEQQAGEGERESEVDVGDGKALVGEHVRNKFGLTGAVKDFDPETKLYQVAFANGSNQDLTWAELEGLLPKEIRRISRTAPDTSKDPDTTSTPLGGTSIVAQEQEVEGAEIPKETTVPDENGPKEIEPLATENAATEEDAENVVTMEEDDDGMANIPVVKVDGDGGDTDSSLDRELLRVQKKRKKRRAHVLTLQKYKGKKRKRKVEADDEAEDEDGKALVEAPRSSDVEEAMPRLESRVKKLSEVSKSGPKAVKRQKQKENVRVLKGILKQSIAPFEDAELGTPRAVSKSKDLSLLLERTPAVEKPDVATILQAKPSPFDRGIKLRGRKLKKKINGKFYRGEVADYDRRTRFYKIFYEDGDEEKLMWKDVEPMLASFDEMARWDKPDETEDKSKDKAKEVRKRAAGNKKRQKKK